MRKKLRWHEKRWEQLWSAEKSGDEERGHVMGLNEAKKAEKHDMKWDWDRMTDCGDCRTVGCSEHRQAAMRWNLGHRHFNSETFAHGLPGYYLSIFTWVCMAMGYARVYPNYGHLAGNMTTTHRILVQAIFRQTEQIYYAFWTGAIQIIQHYIPRIL